MARLLLTDEEWGLIADVFPNPAATGRPPRDPRQVVDGIHRDWCPQCEQLVEPKVPDALPGATLGHRTAVMTGWMHYGLGNTLSQIIEIFNYHLQMKLTAGGLIQLWRRLQEVLFPWYEQIQREALASAVLHGERRNVVAGGRHDPLI